MFRFPQDHRQDPLGDVRSAERWLASLPANDPLASQRELHGRARTARRRAPRAARRRARGRVPSSTRTSTASCATLTTQYVEHASRSSQDRETSSGRRCTTSRRRSPRATRRSRARSSDHAPRSKWQALLPALIARQIVHLGRDAKLRLYRCERWIRGEVDRAPRAVHARVRAADRAPAAALDADGRPHDDRARVPDGARAAARRPGQPRRRSRSNGSPAQLDEWCQPLRLTLEPSSATSFYVDLGRQHGIAAPLARRRSRAACCSSTCSRCTRCCSRIAPCSSRRCETSRRSEQDSRSTASSSSSSSSSPARIDPEFRPLARRGERKPASGAVRRAIVGFANISAFVRVGQSAMPTLATQRRPQLRQHDGARRVRALAQRDRARSASIARRTSRAFARAGRAVGDEGHQRIRIPPARADERRRAVDHAQHARGRCAARGENALGARHRPPDAAALRRRRGDRAAAHREHARRASSWSSSARRATPTYSVDGEHSIRSPGAGSTASSSRSAGAPGEAAGAVADRARRSSTSASRRYTLQTRACRSRSIRHGRAARAARRTGSGRSIEPIERPTDAAARRHAAALTRRADGRRPLRRDLSRRTAGTSRAIQHRARVLRPLGQRSRALRAVLGRRIRRDRRVHVLGPAAAGEPPVERARARSACERGDKVALILPQRPETVVAHIAVYQLGAVAVPLSFLFGPEALEYRLDDSEAKVAFVDPQSLPNLAPIRDALPGVAHVIGVAGAREACDHAVRSAARRARRRASTPVDTRADDPAILVYTSGTTGPPKGALMPHRCLLGNLPGFVHSHDGYPRDGRPVLVAGRLGVDRRPHGRAAADALLRPADRRLPRPLRSRARVLR